MFSLVTCFNFFLYLEVLKLQLIKKSLYFGVVLPYVKNAFKDVAVVEQKTLSLTCIVLSTVPTTVKWVLSTFEGT